jgi:hypothetical protein
MTKKLRIVRATRSRLTVLRNRDMFAKRCGGGRHMHNLGYALLTMGDDVSSGQRTVRRSNASHALYDCAASSPVWCRSSGVCGVRAAAESPLNPHAQTCACLHDLAGSDSACNALVSGKQALTTAWLLAKRDYLRGEINLDARGLPLNVTT